MDSRRSSVASPGASHRNLGSAPPLNFGLVRDPQVFVLAPQQHPAGMRVLETSDLHIQNIKEDMTEQILRHA